MDSYIRIEPETETHRTEKALEQLAPGTRLPLERGSVRIVIAQESSTFVGQHILTLLVHLLARMKGLVAQIDVCGPVETAVLRGVPLSGETLGEGLVYLVTGLSGPKSDYVTTLSLGDDGLIPDVTVVVGTGDADICLGADAWRALVGNCVAGSAWDNRSPLGPYLAATIGAAEVLKLLLGINLGWDEGVLVENLAFSLFNYSTGAGAAVGPDVRAIDLRGVAIAGAGAGGTAALYTLASLPDLTGRLTIVEPGSLKLSSVGRYLMTTYEQVHAPIHKLESVRRFTDAHAPSLELEPVAGYWHEVEREWQLVLSTVDTAQAKRDVQRSEPETILDAA